MFQTETQATVAIGEEVSLGEYSVRYDSLAVFDTNDNRNVARSVVSVFQDGKFVDELYPRRDFYYESRQPVTIPGVRSTMEEDMYVLLVDWEEISVSSATFKLYHNPLVSWLWIGSIVLIVGTAVAAWPEKETQKVKVAAHAARKLAS
jgi:cytochrome c-type biogenesis protein CcmF